MEKTFSLSPFYQLMFGLVAGIFLVIAMLVYIKNLLKGEITPRPISWIGWFLLMGISIYSQIVEKGFEWGQITTIISIIGCFIIFFLSLRKGIIEKNDWWCFGFGMACGLVYLVTCDTWITTGFGITADFLIAIPTFRNAFDKSESERSPAWILGFIGYAITLPSFLGLNIVYLLFPVYLFFLNGFMMYLTYFRKQKSLSKT